MSNVIIEDYRVIEVIDQVIQEVYEIRKAQLPSGSTLQRRTARVGQTLLNTLKKHVRQAPFNPDVLVNEVPKLKPKLVQEEVEPEDYQLKEEADELFEKAIATAAQAAQRWKTLTEDLEEAIQPPHVTELAESANAHQQEIQRLANISEHTKARLREFIRTLSEKTPESSVPTTPSEAQTMMFDELMHF